MGFEAVRSKIKRVYGHFKSIVMGCGCKRRMQFEDEYGEKQKESVLDKGMRYAVRGILYVMTFVFAVVVTPFVLVYLLFKLFFSKDKGIRLPKKFAEVAAAMDAASQKSA